MGPGTGRWGRGDRGGGRYGGVWVGRRWGRHAGIYDGEIGSRFGWERWCREGSFCLGTRLGRCRKGGEGASKGCRKSRGGDGDCTREHMDDRTRGSRSHCNHERMDDRNHVSVGDHNHVSVGDMDVRNMDAWILYPQFFMSIHSNLYYSQALFHQEQQNNFLMENII